MPKNMRETIERFNKRMVQMYPDILNVESSILFCKLCLCNINGNKIFSVQQHFRTLKHRSALELNLTGATLGWNTAPTPPPISKIQLNTFSLDLCTTFLEANIPLETIDNPAMRLFLQKYTKNIIPKEIILKTEYVPSLYNIYIEKLQQKAKNKPIWISITESIERDQNLIVNFVFGLIEEHEKGKSYLLNMASLKRANASSLAAFFNHSLQILWPGKILYENIYLVVTEATPYIMTAIQSLKILYPNMIYINCMLQAYDRLVEFIRLHFSSVDMFIVCCEAVFLKSPHRLHFMRSKYHYLNLPSTSGGTARAITWLNAAIYYSNSFLEINTLLELLSVEDEAECIQQARDIIQNTTLETDLNYLKQNFSRLLQTVTKLENRDLNLNESLATINHVKAILQATKRPEFINKFKQIINENNGLQELIMLNKSNNSIMDYKTSNHKQNLWLYKFVPIVSADIKHLSYAKSLLENNKKQTFDIKNLKKEECEINLG